MNQLQKSVFGLTAGGTSLGRWRPMRACMIAAAAGVLCSSMGAIALAESVIEGVEFREDDGQSIQVVSDRRVLASHITRCAMLDLGLRPVPTTADYQLAAIALSMALELDPKNAELARSVVEAAWSAGDQELMISATRKVIAADPKDTVAQLRLVSSIINQRQTADGRLELYNRFLGDAGRKLDVSVRSRLALDAALLEREMGDTDRFAERLHLATKLDVSNKAAASLSAQYYSELAGDSLMLLDRQIKLLYADPLDANVHLTIARILAREGAFEEANRFLMNSIHLFKIESGRAPPMVEEIRLAVDWQINGAQKVLDDLNPMLMDRRASAQERIDSYIEAALPTDDLLNPDEILYELGIDKLRLLATLHLGDDEGVESVLSDIERTVNNEINQIGMAMGNVGADQSVLIQKLVKSFSDFQMMRAVGQLQAERIRQDIATIIETVPALETHFQSVEPIALYAEGKYEEALVELQKYPPSPMLSLIKAGAFEKLGEPEKAIEVYVRVSQVFSVEAYGSFARSRLEVLGEGGRVITTAGLQMRQVVKTVPNWLDQMTTRPEFYMYLQIEPIGSEIDPLDESMVRIRLRNLAPIPLALGPSQPIDSNFLLESILAKNTMGFAGTTGPKVLDLGHRLRLEPREELVVELRGNSPMVQWLMKMQSSSTYRLRYRLLQSPQLRIPQEVILANDLNADAPVYGIINSPLGLTAETSLIPRTVLGETALSADEFVAQLGSVELDDRRRAVAAAAGRLLLPEEGKEFNSFDKTTLIEGLMDAYTRAKSDERAEMICLLPQRHQVPEMLSFDDHVVSLLLSDALIDSRVDPMVLLGVLITRTDEKDSPVFDTLEQSDDPRLGIIAKIIQDRLASFEPTLGTVGPGVEPMNPSRDRIGF